ASLPDEPRETLGPAGAGDQAEVHLGLSELRSGHGDPDVRGHRHLAAPAEAEAVDRRDDDLAAGFDLIEDPLARFREALASRRVERIQLDDVGARDEGLLPRPRDRDGADLG